MEKCRLCGELAQLRNSHIIPEFYYKPIYDEKHRFFELSTNIEHKTKFPQKGIREYLLCDNCENRLSKYETYSATMFGSKTRAVKKGDEIIVNNIDYKLFKLHQISILWRIAISSRNIFSKIELPEVEPELRSMIINNDPGNYNDYGCTLTFVVNEKALLTDLITTPEMLIMDSNKYVRLIFGGYIWIFSLQKDENSFCNEYFLSKTGIMKIKIREANSLKILKSYANDLYRAGKLGE